MITPTAASQALPPMSPSPGGDIGQSPLSDPAAAAAAGQGAPPKQTIFTGVWKKALLGGAIGAAASFILPGGPLIGGVLGAISGAIGGILLNVLKAKRLAAEQAQAGAQMSGGQPGMPGQVGQLPGDPGQMPGQMPGGAPTQTMPASALMPATQSGLPDQTGAPGQTGAPTTTTTTSSSSSLPSMAQTDSPSSVKWTAPNPVVTISDPGQGAPAPKVLQSAPGSTEAPPAPPLAASTLAGGSAGPDDSRSCMAG